jgi:hypothetical protein
MEALHLLIRAGFIINWEKSSLTPSTDFPFLGFQWNTVQASIAIPQVKIDTFHSQASILSNLTSPTCRQILVLTVLIAALFKAVPLLRLKGRWLQISINSVYSSEMDLQKTVILSPQARRNLSWIISLTPLQCFTPLWNLSPEACDLDVQTDASKICYYIWFQGSLHQGHLDGTTTHFHIDVLESTAMWIFLDSILLKSSRQCNIFWKINNTTALAYFKKEGGTCTPAVHKSWRLQRRFWSRLTRCPSASCRSSFPQGKTSWQMQRLASKRFQEILAASSLSVPGDLGKMGFPLHRPLRQPRLQTDSTLLQLGRV